MPLVGLLIFLLKKLVPGTDESQTGTYGILDEKIPAGSGVGTL